MKNEISFGFLGMGASGTVAFIETVNHLADNFAALVQSQQPVSFVLIDEGGDFAKGEPYKDSTPAFMLNQRASRMSCIPGKPNDFCDWLEQQKSEIDHHDVRGFKDAVANGSTPEHLAIHNPQQYIAHEIFNAHENAYLSRATYGAYLNARYNQALKKLNAMNKEWMDITKSDIQMLSFKMITSRVADIVRLDSGEFRLGIGYAVTDTSVTNLQFGYHYDNDLGSQWNKASAETIDVSHLIIATGHQMNNSLSFLRGKAGYADTPFSLNELKNALGTHNGKSPITVVGTGQAMLDALAGLEGLGYQGRYNLMSRTLIEPWPQDYKTPNDKYQLSFVSPEKIEKEYNRLKITGADKQLLAKLMPQKITAFLQDEMYMAAHHAGGGQSVINNIHANMPVYDRLFTKLGLPEITKLLGDLVDRHDNNSTSPARYALYKRLKETGRINLIQGGAGDVYENISDKKFNARIMRVIGNASTTFVDASVLINAASMERRAVKNDGKPVCTALARLIETGCIICDAQQGTLTTQDENCIIIGPASGKEIWGVPYMREPAAKSVHGLCAKLFSTTPVQEALKPRPI